VAKDAAVTQPVEADLERVWREDGPKLWRAVAAYTADPEIASDAVAEAFAQALSRLPEIRELLPWLWRTSFRVATKELRRRRRRNAVTLAGSYEIPEPLVETLRALRHLSHQQRAVVVLHDYADRPTSEIAETLGIAPATVRVHLSKGRRRLREILGGRDDI
jgi:RNA polymerase sigma-70 factor (ECF subfamily)